MVIGLAIYTLGIENRLYNKAGANKGMHRSRASEFHMVPSVPYARPGDAGR
jgi:hypothetical protein